MTNKRKEKISSLLKNLIGEFLTRISLGKNLISISRLEIAKDLKSAKIFISVYPEKNGAEILKTLNKKRPEIKKYIGSKTQIKFLPQLEFEIDQGESRRRKIEELLQKYK